jgi:hypothetical protein
MISDGDGLIFKGGLFVRRHSNGNIEKRGGSSAKSTVWRTGTAGYTFYAVIRGSCQ